MQTILNNYYHFSFALDCKNAVNHGGNMMVCKCWIAMIMAVSASVRKAVRATSKQFEFSLFFLMVGATRWRGIAQACHTT